MKTECTRRMPATQGVLARDRCAACIFAWMCVKLFCCRAPYQPGFQNRIHWNDFNTWCMKIIKSQREFVKTRFFLLDFVKLPIFNRIFAMSRSLVHSSPILNRSASHKTLQRLTEPHISTLTSNCHFRVYLLLCFSHPYLDAKTSKLSSVMSTGGPERNFLFWFICVLSWCNLRSCFRLTLCWFYAWSFLLSAWCMKSLVREFKSFRDRRGQHDGANTITRESSLVTPANARVLCVFWSNLLRVAFSVVGLNPLTWIFLMD